MTFLKSIFGSRKSVGRVKPRSSSTRRPHALMARRLGTEALEARVVLAVSGTAPAIIGTVFVDANNNGQFNSGEGIQNITVRLFLDDGDNVFETNGSDTQVGTDQLTTSTGLYEFDNLNPDATYFVQQPAQTVAGQSYSAKVSSAMRPGDPGLVIDSFDTNQNSSASPTVPTPAESRVTATDAVGGQRDMVARWNSGSNTFDMDVNPFGSGTLQVSAGPGVDGLGTIVWDGADSVDNQISMGLNGLDLTTSGANTGIMLRFGAEPATATLTLRMYENTDTNFSQASVSVPTTSGGTATQFMIIPFSSFTGAVQASNVDAIRMTIDAGTAATDTEVAVIGAIGPKVANFLNQIQADLSVTKSDNVTNVQPLQQLTYTIRVTNSGPDNVQGATVVDNFPSGLTNISYTSSATGTVTGNTASGTGNISDTVNMTSGSILTYTVTATVASSASGTIVNTATVTAPSGVLDINLTNNTSTDTDTVQAVADLSITKTDNRTTVQAGQQTTYQIVVANAGPSAVTGATVADTFPTNLSNISYTSSVTTGSVTGNTASGTGNIADTITIAANSSVTYVVTATVVSTATGTVVNTATVTAPSGVTEVNTANNTATDTDTITPLVDLAITKTDGVTQVTAGQANTYTIVVSNVGTNAVTGATVVDTFPGDFTSVTFTSVAAGGASGNRTSGSGNLNETINLPVGASVTYTVSGTVATTAGSSLVNTATVSAPTNVTETNLSNNTATDTDTVLPAPATLAGRVYLDLNGNGVKNSTEPGIPGVIVTLIPQGGGAAVTTTTDANGAYSFTGLAPGSYTVRETHPSAYRDGSEQIGTGAVQGQVAANDEFFVQLASGNNAAAFDFGELRVALSKRDLLASSF